MLDFLYHGLVKKKLELQYKTDLHSHFIPEIDDGCASIEESLMLILQMKKLGYKKLLTTPHIMHSKYPNTNDIIKNRLFELRGMLKVKNINIEVEAAAEYYCDTHFLELITKNNLLYFGDKYVLFELSYTKRPKNLEFIIEKLLNKGYKPVLAHPERYRFLTEVHEYRDLKDLGVLFQLNVNSLGGYYGNQAQKKALLLAKKSMVDFIGSDIHNQTHMDHYKMNIAGNHIEMLFRNNRILNDNI